jgi:glucosylceramidase
MTTKKWTRREALKVGAAAAAGAAVLGGASAAKAGAGGAGLDELRLVRSGAGVGDAITTERAEAESRVSGDAVVGARGVVVQLPAPQLLDDPKWSCVATTEASAWQTAPMYKPSFSFEQLNLNITQAQPGAAAKSTKTMVGFGACFNELGWASLSALSDADRDSVMKEFFQPGEGARFNYCRMPIGANDFAREAYSYNETDGDFTMKNFSIAHDKDTLVPFIQAAKRYQPELKLWASPWSPPTWMKHNHFYAEAKAYAGFKDNGIKPEQIGHEGEDMFIQEPRYFEAYALYFQKFIEAYRAEGIQIGMVMPQNEFNSAQNFPSCTWTAAGLAHFIEYLGPAIQKIGVDVFFGTLERGNIKLLDATMTDKKAAKFIKGVGVQWAGKNALAEIDAQYPALTIFQSEQECGFGTNTWAYTAYCWQLMKEYFRRGARGYFYWNLATAKGGMSTWGWPQNSLVSIDTAAKTFQYNHDYYLLKHMTHFVDVGARRVETSGTCDDAIAFVNPDGSVVALLRNGHPYKQLVQLQVGDKAASTELAADSFATVTLKA